MKYKFKISRVHRLIEDAENEYETGTIIEIFGIEIFDNVK